MRHISAAPFLWAVAADDNPYCIIERTSPYEVQLPIMRLRERRLRCNTVETGGCPNAAAVISADIGLRRSVIGTTTTFRIGDLEQSAARGTVCIFLDLGLV